MIQNVLFAISFLFLQLTQLISIVPEDPMFNYATNVSAPFLKAVFSPQLRYKLQPIHADVVGRNLD